jgi:hypothetical protein
MDEENANQETLSDRAKISMLQVNTDAENSNSNFRLRGGSLGPLAYPTMFLFYFLKLDKLNWNIRIPKWVGIGKGDIVLPGALLMLMALELVLLVWVVSLFA